MKNVVYLFLFILVITACQKVSDEIQKVGKSGMFECVERSTYDRYSTNILCDLRLEPFSRDREVLPSDTTIKIRIVKMNPYGFGTHAYLLEKDGNDYTFEFKKRCSDATTTISFFNDDRLSSRFYYFLRTVKRITSKGEKEKRRYGDTSKWLIEYLDSKELESDYKIIEGKTIHYVPRELDSIYNVINKYYVLPNDDIEKKMCKSINKYARVKNSK